MENRAILLTGACGGLGSAVLRLLLDKGYRVFATDLRAQSVQSIYRDYRVPREFLYASVLDVRKRTSWERNIERMKKVFGQIDGLIHLAGVLSPHSAFSPSTLEMEKNMRQHFEVNVFGSILGYLTIRETFLEQGKGHLIVVCSLAGLTPVPGLGLYSASKFAQRSFFLSIYPELREKGIALSLLYPDAIDTPMLAIQLDRPETHLTFSGAILTPEQVARVILKRLEKPKLETAIPKSRGLLSKAASLTPGFAFRFVLPWTQWIGKRKQSKWRRHVAGK